MSMMMSVAKCARMILCLVVTGTALAACGAGQGGTASTAAGVFGGAAAWSAVAADSPLRQQIFSITVPKGVATAFAVSPTRVLTNAHVVAACGTLSPCPVTLTDAQGTSHPLYLVRERPVLDYVLLESNTTLTETPLTLATQAPAQGEAITIPEWPLVNGPGTDPVFVEETGTIDGFGTWQGVQVMLDHVNTVGGGSGSPLIDAQGNVVGLHKGVSSQYAANQALVITDVAASMSRSFSDDVDWFFALRATAPASEMTEDVAALYFEALRTGDQAGFAHLLQVLRQAPQLQDIEAFFKLGLQLDLASQIAGGN